MVDMVVQGAGRWSGLTFTVPKQSVNAAAAVVGKVAKELGCGPVTTASQIAILSVFGIGIRTHTGVGVRMFQALSQADINVEMVGTSEMRVNVVVAAKGPASLKALQRVCRCAGVANRV
jgi:aspartate kinase